MSPQDHKELDREMGSVFGCMFVIAVVIMAAMLLVAMIVN